MMVSLASAVKACAIIIQATVGLALAGATTAQTVRTVALSGQPAPGTPSGVVYGTFDAPALNAGGRTAFDATLTGSGVTGANQRGIWSEGSGPLALIARSGSQAVGMPNGVTYIDVFFPSALNDAGQTAFSTFITGANYLGIWSGDSNNLSLVTHLGRQAPGTPNGVKFDQFNYPSIVFNDAGQTAFASRLYGNGVGASNDRGIWSEGSGSLSLIARKGSRAPGTPAGVNYLEVGAPMINAYGATAFRATLTGNQVTALTDQGIWLERSGIVALVVRTGDQAPGTPSGVKFNSLDGLWLNAAGQIAFGAYISGSGISEQGIWSGGSGSLALVTRTGSQAPGTPSGVNYSFFNSPVLNDAGQTAFRAYISGSGVTGANDQGIWSEGSGSLALVARERNQAPGTPSGVMYNELFTPVALNALGQTAFSATLIGSGVTASNDLGIWATDTGGQPQLIARTGGLLEVAAGDVRKISSLDFVAGSGNGDGQPSGFNDMGQVAFRATFTDGSSGIFVSSAVAIPEPATLVLQGLASIAVVAVRRRRA